MDKIQKFQAEVSQKKFLTSKVCLVKFSLVKPSKIEFFPGQFISLQIKENIRRCYSICSLPFKKNLIELIVDISPGGKGSKFFEKLKKGDSVCFLGPMGKFTLYNTRSNAVFLATGTGVAPFRPMIEKKITCCPPLAYKTTFILGFRYKEDIFWQKHFEDLAKKHSNFNFILTLSRPDSSWKGKTGYVQNHLDAFINAPLKNKPVYYLCGGKNMIKGVIEYLKSKKVKDKNIRFEMF